MTGEAAGEPLKEGRQGQREGPDGAALHHHSAVPSADRDVATPTPTGRVSVARRFLSVGIRGRFMLYSGLIVVILLAAVGMTLERRQREFTREQFEARGVSIARMAAELASAGLLTNDRISLTRALARIAGDEHLLYVLLSDLQDGPVASAGRGWPDATEPAPRPQGNDGSLAIRSVFDRDSPDHPIPVLDVVIPVRAPDSARRLLGWVRIGVPLDPMYREISKTRLRLLWVGEIGLAVTLLASYLIGRRIAHPISQLLSATIRAARGDLLGRIKVGSHDEIGDLARHFNHMVEQIQQHQKKIEDLNRNLERKVKLRTHELESSNHALKKAFQELKQAESLMIHSEKMASLGQLVAGIAHEINTPTSAINAAAENLRENIGLLGDAVRALATLELTEEAQTCLGEFVRKATSLAASQTRPSLAQLRDKSQHLEEAFVQLGLGEQRELAFSLARLDLEKDLLELLRIIPAEQAPVVLEYAGNIAIIAASMSDVRYSVDTIIRMVRALKTYSHLDQAEMMEISVHEGLETTLVILHNQIKYGVEVERHYGALPMIRGNPSELNQIWTNILMNAIQAMKGKGHVTIETSESEGWISVKIIDDGPGIPSNILGRIFDPFFTTKDQGEGTGLGLSICQQLVRRNRGKITVASRPGETCFEVLFPVPERTSPPAQRQTA